jgi:6-phosphogluconolactonase
MKTKMRGKFLVSFAAVALAWNVQGKEYWVYFGTYTDALTKGIYVAQLDAETGKLSEPKLAAESASPAYLAVSPNGHILYAANEVTSFNGEKVSGVSCFGIDGKSGALYFTNEKSSGGEGACHVSVDAAADVLLAANYGDGSVKSFRLGADGSIGADGSYIKHHGSSVNTNRQAAAHGHFIQADPSDRFALACDLGMDKVVVYQINHAEGTLAAHSFATVPPGSGSRHLVFSPDGKFVHVANEMGCSVTTFAWDAKAGMLTQIETVPALPPGVSVSPAFTAAEIRVNGNHVYESIRGHDSVTVFTADPQTGRLTFVQNVPSGGKVPRGLGIDPTGRWLFTGNQKSSNAVEFAIDPATGKLSTTGRELKIGSPIDVEFVEKN